MKKSRTPPPALRVPPYQQTTGDYESDDLYGSSDDGLGAFNGGEFGCGCTVAATGGGGNSSARSSGAAEEPPIPIAITPKKKRVPRAGIGAGEKVEWTTPVRPGVDGHDAALSTDTGNSGGGPAVPPLPKARAVDTKGFRLTGDQINAANRNLGHYYTGSESSPFMSPTSACLSGSSLLPVEHTERNLRALEAERRGLVLLSVGE
jgi:hypothetical protein